MKHLAALLFSLTIALAPGIGMTASASGPKESKSVSSRTHFIDNKSSRSVIPPRKTASVATPFYRMASQLGTVHQAVAADRMPDLQGLVIYNTTWGEYYRDYGYYTVPTHQGSRFEKVLSTTGLLGPQFAVEIGGIVYVHDLADFWQFQEWSINGYDATTGERLFRKVVDPTLVGPDGALDPTTGKVYLLAYNEQADGFNLSCLTYDNENVAAEVISQVGRYNALACDNTGQLYAIGYDGFLYKMDKATAEVTRIGATGYKPAYMASATIDQRTNRMFWNVCDADDNGTLVEVNLETGIASPVYDFPEANEMVGIRVVEYAEMEAPAVATDLKANFYDASLSGTFSFTAPEGTYDGNPAEGDISYTISANGTELATGTCAYGEAVTRNIEVPESGYYLFSVVTANSAGDSPAAKIRYYLGYAAPTAPAGVSAAREGNTVTIKWDAVVRAATDGLFRSEDVTYNVVRNDGTVVAENLTDTQCTDTLADAEAVEIYTYQLTSHHHGLSSEATITNAVSFGFTTAPWSVEFKDLPDLSQFTLLDENHDGRTWGITYDAAFISYNYDLDMDDWLITPGIRMDYGYAYRVSFEIMCQSPEYRERIEVKYGKDATVAAMTGTLLPPTNVNIAMPKLYTADIFPDEDCVYYIGFHGISPANGYYLKVKSVSVSAGSSVLVPAQVSDLLIEPTEPFALTVNGTFTAPATNLAGTPIESLQKVELSRNGEVIKTFLTPPPGQQLNFTDEVSEDDTYTYSVISYNETGESPVAETEIYIGATIGATPTVVGIEETSAGTVRLSWEPVTTDVNGDPLPAEGVTYVVVDRSGAIKADNLTDTEFTTRACGPRERTFAQYGVAVRTRAGAGAVRFSEAIPVGAAYAGLMESFASGQPQYIWGVANIEGNASWQVNTDTYFADMTASDHDHGILFMEGRTKNDSGEFVSGKIKVPTDSPALTFRTYTTQTDNATTQDDNGIIISVREPEGEWTVMLETTPAMLGGGRTGWAKAIIDLSAYAGKDIQFKIKAITMSSSFTFFDDLRLTTVHAHDLEFVHAQAPERVTPGSTFTIDAIISNEGTEEIADHSIELYVGGTLVDDFPCEPLEPGCQFVATFGCDMSMLAEEAMELRIVGNYEADENPMNNESEIISVEPIISNLPYVQDLSGDTDGSDVVLTWTAPYTDDFCMPSEVDFEDGTPFATEYLDWIFVDMDKSAVGGIGNIELPGITTAESQLAFFVMDGSYDPLGLTLGGHSGSKTLVSMYRADGGLTDDWAISPELSGTRQFINFYAQSYDGQYPETMEMYYSTGSTEPKDFIKVAGVERVAEGWNRYSFEVPEGALRFAIRSNSGDAFLLMLDDFTFADKDAERGIEVSGFNVWCDGAKIGNTSAGVTTFRHTGSDKGVYAVTTLYGTHGESRGSNRAEVNVTGLDPVSTDAISITAHRGQIHILGAEGLEVSIWNAAGLTAFASSIAPAELTVSVPQGVYVVKAGARIAKIVVR